MSAGALIAETDASSLVAEFDRGPLIAALVVGRVVRYALDVG